MAPVLLIADPDSSFSLENAGDVLNFSCDRFIDSLALVELYEATDGPNWTNSWDLNAPMDTWYGVTLNEKGCVVYIRIRNNGLTGNLPVLTLPDLIHLDLNQNALHGELPALSSLPKLEWLFLIGNQLSGTLPDLDLPQLTDLALDANQFSGEITNFSKLPNLGQLALTFNQLEGEIPDFGNLPKLLGLYLCNNDLSGPVPSFVNFPNFINLFIRGNRFTFEDILPTFEENMSIITQNGGLAGYNYRCFPQKVFLNDTTIASIAGEMLSIDLMIDDTVTTNIYRWFKDGELFREVYGHNQLIFDEVRANDGGTYQCQVVNQIANHNFGFLSSGQITIEVLPDDCEVNALIQDTEDIPGGIYRAKDTITSAGIINSGNRVTLTAGKSISLVPGFRVVAGAEFSAYIEDCELNSPESHAELPAFEEDKMKSQNVLTLSFYPNPTNHSIHLEYQLSESTSAQIYLTDMHGRIVKTVQNEVQQEAGNYNISVSVNDLPAGIYLVHLLTGKERVYSRLVLSI